MKPQSRKTYLQKRAVVLEPEERKAVALLQQMRALRKDQVVRRREKQNERKAEHRKKVEKADEAKGEKQRERKKEYMRLGGMKSNKRQTGDDGDSGRKRRKTKED